MFCEKSYRMPSNERRVLFQNHAKMRSMIDSTARFLADVLQLKDEEIDARDPLVEVFRKEIHYFITLTKDRRMEQMDDLMQMCDFVARSEDLAYRMRECARSNAGYNIDINGFTHEEPYYHSDQLIQEGAVCTTIDIGDLGHRLMTEVRSKALPWLEEVDRVLCESADIKRTDAACESEEFVSIKSYLSNAIAERVTAMSYGGILDDSLSSRALEALLNNIYEGAVPHARAMKQKDAAAVRMLLTLASNPEGEDARRLLENSLDELRAAVAQPPRELAVYSQQINLDRLSRAFAPDMDIEVRVAMVVFWSDNSRKTVSAANTALKQIEAWQPTDRVVSFHGILKPTSYQKAACELMLPPMSFLDAPRCFACRQQGRRSGLTEGGERAELLVRVVWEMASRGYFTTGVLSADIVVPVTLDAMVMARMAAATIAKERDVNKLGFRMCGFVSNLYNMEGYHVKALDKAACSLSRFSCQELETVFDTSGDCLHFLCDCLTMRTQAHMVFKPNEKYRSFATDAIGVLLPLIHQRRCRLGIPTMMRSNGLLDVLRTVPKMNTWKPTNGLLTLTLDDLRQGHKSTRGILDDLHANKVLVSRKGTPPNKRKVEYTFDTFILWSLISEFAALRTT